MKKIIIITLLSSCILSGCSSRYASNGESIYLRSQNGSNLAVPQQSSDSISHFYDLPQPTQNPLVNITPPAS